MASCHQNFEPQRMPPLGLSPFRVLVPRQSPTLLWCSVFYHLPSLIFLSSPHHYRARTFIGVPPARLQDHTKLSNSQLDWSGRAVREPTHISACRRMPSPAPTLPGPTQTHHGVTVRFIIDGVDLCLLEQHLKGGPRGRACQACVGCAGPAGRQDLHGDQKGEQRRSDASGG